MRLKKNVVVCTVLLVFTSAVSASFLSNFIRSTVVLFTERQEVEQAPDCSLSADDALERTVELLNDGRQAEAEDLIKSAVKSHRDDVRILFAKGVFERSRWSKGAADVWFALARKAKGNESLSRASWISTQLDRHRSVEENMAELIRLSDENPDNIYLLWLGAIQCREQSRFTSPLPQTKKQKFAQMGKERYQKLFTHFELGPALAHHTYANILTEDTGDYEEALEHRIKALSMEATNARLEGFADTLTKMKKSRWACAVWAQAVRKNNSNGRYYNRWGDALFHLKLYDEAEEKYLEAIRLQPHNGYYWRDLGNTLARLDGERKNEAFKAFEEAVKFGNERATEGMVWCYQTGHGVEKDEEQAYGDLQRYLNVNPDHAPSLRTMGYYHNTGIGTGENPQEALSFYEKAVAQEPNNWYGINGLASALTKVEDPALQDNPRALRLAKRAVEMDRNDSTLGTLAAACFKNGLYEEAVQTLNKSITFWKTLNPGKPVPDEKQEQLREYKAKLKSGESF